MTETPLATPQGERTTAQALALDTARQLRALLERETDRGRLLYASVDTGCEFCEIQLQRCVVTITLSADGGIRDAQEWRDGLAVQLSGKEARAILESAIEHREALDDEPAPEGPEEVICP